jgi:DNA-directed RNA polymerase specialized sigma24 family protein
MQFSREESLILESLSMSDIIADLDLEEKIIFLRLYSHNMSIREAAKTFNWKHTTLLEKVVRMRKKIAYHLR